MPPHDKGWFLNKKKLNNIKLSLYLEVTMEHFPEVINSLFPSAELSAGRRLKLTSW